MTAKDNGGAAFPANPNNAHCDPGMTLRDWFAGQALTGLLSATAHPNSTGSAQLSDDEWAEKAFSIADAMLEARAK